MKLIPVVVPPAGETATAEQLAAASRLAWNAQAVYQRMIGRVLQVGTPISVANTANTAPAMTRANEDRVAWDDRSLFNGVANSLDAAGYDLGADVYATWLLGNPLDGSGRGGSWTMGWMMDGARGGLAVMGEKRLQTAVTERPDPRTGYYYLSDPPKRSDPGTEARYAVWLATHEVGHALGLPHTNGTPLDPVLMTQSVMAYGRHGWVLGEHAHRVGLLEHEIDWLRGHALFANSAEGHMKQFDPYEAQLVLDEKVPLRIGLGPGVLVEEMTGG